MRRPGALLLALVAAAVAAGCGSDDSEPKRAVDARTEAIHFFPADQPFLALLDTSTAERLELARTVRALRSSPALGAFTGSAAFASRPDLDLTPFTDLLTDEDPDDGLAASQAALGLKPSDPREEVLLVLVSDSADEMEEAAERVAADAGLEEAGDFHDARVFSEEGSALAVRDGVVLLGGDADSLREAISLRDSNQDKQLDEDQVADLLRELPTQPPLVAYADVAALERTDPAVTALALGERRWLRAMGRTAIGVTAEAAGLRIEVFANVEPDEGPAIPLGEEPKTVAVARGEAGELVGGGPAQSSAFRDAMISLSPFVARASLSDEELRATVLGSR